MNLCNSVLEKMADNKSAAEIVVTFKPDGEVYYPDTQIKLEKIHAYLDKPVEMYNFFTGNLIKIHFLLPRYACTDLSVPEVRKSKRKEGKMALVTFYPAIIKPYVRRSLGLIMLLCAWDKSVKRTNKAFAVFNSKIAAKASDTFGLLLNSIRANIKWQWLHIVPDVLRRYRRPDFLGRPSIADFFKSITEIVDFSNS